MNNFYLQNINSAALGVLISLFLMACLIIFVKLSHHLKYRQSIVSLGITIFFSSIFLTLSFFRVNLLEFVVNLFLSMSIFIPFSLGLLLIRYFNLFKYRELIYKINNNRKIILLSMSVFVVFYSIFLQFFLSDILSTYFPNFSPSDYSESFHF